MERFGLVGLPNAGKCSLYNALTGGGALAAPYAFATKDPNIGVAKVPDERLDRLAEMSKSQQRRARHRAVRRHRRPRRGRQQGRGPGQQVPGQHPRGRRHRVRPAGVRGRRRDRVRRIPLEHLRVVEIELALADLETVEKRLNQATRPPSWTRRWATRSRRCRPRYDALSEGRPLYRAGLKADHRELLAPYFLLTNRPVLAVVNVGEDDLDDDPRGRGPRRRRAQRRRRQRRGHRHVRAARGRGGIDRGPGRAGRDARGLRARRGRPVPDGPQRLPPARPAHVPHHRRQGVAGVDVLRAARRPRSAPGASTPTSSGASSGPRSSTGTSCSSIGSWTKAKELGKIRVEGKDYVADDGDVMEFRFNV